MPKPQVRLPPADRLVVVLAYDGLCTFEFGVAVEIFGLPRPEMGADWYRFAVAALDPGPMRAEGGVRFLVDGGLDLLDQAGTIVVPGWRGAEIPVPEALVSALRAAAARGARILSICSGVFVLAAAGLLDGRRATTHWRHAEALAIRHPGIRFTPDVLYVDEGAILTSAGSAAGIDLCLHLVRRDFGPVAANRVARRLVVPPHRDGGQAQIVMGAVPSLHEAARIGPLLDAMRANPAGAWPVAHLAARAGMSSRTLLRRFSAATGTTPARWLLDLRLARARDLLEQADHPLQAVAEAAGFTTAAALRQQFRRRFAVTPSAYRESCLGRSRGP
ncbi:transcriptional regulator FtrA [Methylobacterium sp. 37f]|uniref:transcriptional regulator FtrA n=1 Tax=Methylobacterium sp. 37f TaxID=2817058 RepID=UPI001FFCF3B1|nr:transcriptional regulator FtrA [Methylobacterium sp. 37f]MCK2054542.1 transcriptional regulator FtrA [Methylobacterium sp. 37f]